MTDGYKIKKGRIRVNNPDSRNLPSGYQQVEYIQSSGNGSGTGQYINTGISIESGVSLKVEIDFHWLNNTTQERDIFGYYEGQSSDYLIGFSSGYFLTVLNSHTAGSLPATWTPNSYATDTRYNVIAEGVNASSTNTPYLFASNQNGTDTWDISAKLYYCKVWKNNVIIRDFVPCYRKSDSVIGLYDLANDVFYTNSGTGAFTKGSDIPNLIEKQFYPAEKKVYCDFTQSDYGFTFAHRDNNNDLYGINSNGLYIDHSGYGGWGGVSWLVPSNIYSQGELAKVEVTCYATITNCGGGITDNVRASACMQSRLTLIRAERGGSNTSVNTSGNPANTEFKIIIDLDGGLISTTSDSTTLTLNSTQISAAKADWTNGKVCLNQMIGTTSTGICYIRNATFYFTS